jgi:hypothetical protein
MQSIPGGVKSVSQGGVSLSAGPQGFSSFLRRDAGLRKDLQGFRRRIGKAWGEGSGPGTRLQY